MMLKIAPTSDLFRIIFKYPFLLSQVLLAQPHATPKAPGARNIKALQAGLYSFPKTIGTNFGNII